MNDAATLESTSASTDGTNLDDIFEDNDPDSSMDDDDDNDDDDDLVPVHESMAHK